MQTYRLRAGAPVRALAIAAAATLTGAVVLVVTEIFDWPTAVGVSGGVIAVFGLGVLALALIFSALLAVVVEVNDDGFRMKRGRRLQDGGQWTDISRLSLSEQGGLLRLVRDDGEPDLVIIDPTGQRSAELGRLTADIMTRLQHR